MKKPPPGSRLSVSDPWPQNTVQNNSIDRDRDLWLYARSFHKAARTLAASFRSDAGPFAEADVSAVVFMYRHALELHLKAMVLGQDGNFLATKPDALSVHKTHSVSWPAQTPNPSTLFSRRPIIANSVRLRLLLSSQVPG